ncbi:MAG: PKD domain-containing protein, partial [Ekhidna sp.]|nr:PKD domain-containing protein [Ekhidna sp.]
MISTPFKRLPVLILLLLTSWYAIGQDISRVEYFIDQDPGTGKGVPISVAAASTLDQDFALDVTGLSPGLHKLYIRAKAAGASWSIPKTSIFFVISPNDNQPLVLKTDLVAAEYFFDSDPGAGNGEAIPLQKGNMADINWVANTDALDSGQHILYVRAQSQDGLWSPVLADTINVSDVVCSGPIADFTLDVVDINTDLNIQDLSLDVEAGATYAWDVLDDGTVESTDASFDTQFANRGLYPIRLTVTNPDGCSASVIKYAFVTDLDLDQMVTVSGNDSLLVGQTLTLTAPAGFSYEWSTGETTQSIDLTEDGLYRVFLSVDGFTLESETL